MLERELNEWKNQAILGRVELARAKYQCDELRDKLAKKTKGKR